MGYTPNMGLKYTHTAIHSINSDPDSHIILGLVITGEISSLY